MVLQCIVIIICPKTLRHQGCLTNKHQLLLATVMVLGRVVDPGGDDPDPTLEYKPDPDLTLEKKPTLIRPLKNLIRYKIVRNKSIVFEFVLLNLNFD